MGRVDSSSRRDKPGEMGPGAASFVVLGTITVGLGGYAAAGIMAGLLWALGGLAFTVGVYVIKRALQEHRRAQREARISSRLPCDPKQALAVLSTQFAATDPSLSLASDVLREVEEARELAKSDSSRALAKLDRLAETHPRNPVIVATKAEFHLAAAREDLAIPELARAIELGVAGGMGRWAAQCFRDHQEFADRLPVSGGTRRQLQKIINRLGESGTTSANA